jgi:5'-nucleotidase
MKILVTNDDGVHALGIKALAAAMATVGEVIVMAPDRDRSGSSNSLTLHKPLRVKELSPGIISVEGTPSDCVHLALTGYLDFVPNIVVSGFNHGTNLGDDVLYSGTVAAALEARMLGLPAIAFSFAGNPQSHFDTAAAVAIQLVKRFHETPLPHSSLLNVNIPDVSLQEIKGFEITRTGQRHPAGKLHKQQDPRGHSVYWQGTVGEKSDSGVGTDFFAIEHQKVSITPLHVDLTHYNAFDSLVTWSAPLRMDN